ncbi:MAG: hypothetical protein ACI849_001104, partial [Patiriisocius sp.]
MRFFMHYFFTSLILYSQPMRFFLALFSLLILSSAQAQ